MEILIAISVGVVLSTNIEELELQGIAWVHNIN
jgi:hypothetical protein